jgi:hypothetical protein
MSELERLINSKKSFVNNEKNSNFEGFKTNDLSFLRDVLEDESGVLRKLDSVCKSMRPVHRTNKDLLEKPISNYSINEDGSLKNIKYNFDLENNLDKIEIDFVCVFPKHSNVKISALINNDIFSDNNLTIKNFNTKNRRNKEYKDSDLTQRIIENQYKFDKELDVNFLNKNAGNKVVFDDKYNSNSTHTFSLIGNIWEYKRKISIEDGNIKDNSVFKSYKASHNEKLEKIKEIYQQIEPEKWEISYNKIKKNLLFIIMVKISYDEKEKLLKKVNKLDSISKKNVEKLKNLPKLTDLNKPSDTIFFNSNKTINDELSNLYGTNFMSQVGQVKINNLFRNFIDKLTVVVDLERKEGNTDVIITPTGEINRKIDKDVEKLSDKNMVEYYQKWKKPVLDGIAKNISESSRKEATSLLNELGNIDGSQLIVNDSGEVNKLLKDDIIESSNSLLTRNYINCNYNNIVNSKNYYDTNLLQNDEYRNKIYDSCFFSVVGDLKFSKVDEQILYHLKELVQSKDEKIDNNIKKQIIQSILESADFDKKPEGNVN